MTCDTVAFAVGDIVLIKFVNSDPRRPYVVGKWDEPGLCDAYLYFAIKIDQRYTENELSGGGYSEQSVSSTSSSSSQESKSSESASSYSEGIKGLDDYYAFVWNPKVNNFAVINDPVTELPIQFPCRAERLEQWLLDSNDVTQTNMVNRKAGRRSPLINSYGENKTKFLDGYWDLIPEFKNDAGIIYCGGGPIDIDETTMNEVDQDDCHKGDATQNACLNFYCVLDFYNNAWAAGCGSLEFNRSGANPIIGTDLQHFSVARNCTGINCEIDEDTGQEGCDEYYDNFDVYAAASTNATLIADDINQMAMSTYIHSLDGYEVNTITEEDYVFDLAYENHDSVITELVQGDIEYSTITFLGNLYSNWQIQEYRRNGDNYYAQAYRAQNFTIGRRCSAGTFVWLGNQGALARVDNWGDDPDAPWVFQSKHKYNLAYCDTGTYGEDPFSGKSNNSRISEVIDEMMDKFYQEDPGGAILLFGTDIRWVSGAIEAYSSVSSSSLSSSSLSSSSLSESKSSVSSSSESSTSSVSIP
jgi:hypothetical protein